MGKNSKNTSDRKERHIRFPNGKNQSGKDISSSTINLCFTLMFKKTTTSFFNLKNYLKLLVKMFLTI